MDALLFARHNRPKKGCFSDDFIGVVGDALPKGLGFYPTLVSEDDFIEVLWNYICGHLTDNDTMYYEGGLVDLYVNPSGGERDCWVRYYLDSSSILFTEIEDKIGKLFGTDCSGTCKEGSDRLDECREDIRRRFSEIRDELFR